MGLDMYAVTVKRKPTNKQVYRGGIDNFEKRVEIVDEEFYYWRKNRFLHHFMEQLYFSKAVTSEEKDTDFDVDFVKLEKQDLLKLRTCIKENIVETFAEDGYFFGNNDYDEYRREHDLEFVDKALEEIEDGNDVYYYSWW